MVFANPIYLYLILLIIPLILWYVMKQKHQPTLSVATTSVFQKMKVRTPLTFLIHAPFVLRMLTLVFVILVLARPQTHESLTESEREGIDIMMALDISGTMLGEAAAQTAIIVQSSQTVLLGLAAFVISLMWTYKGEQHEEKPTLGVIWDRFPKFVVGFVVASLVFSFLLDVESAKAVGKITKGFTNTLFSIAFVCVGLETRFADIFSKDNRRPLWAFLTAQGFNIVVTLIVAYLLFGVVKPLLA